MRFQSSRLLVGGCVLLAAGLLYFQRGVVFSQSTLSLPLDDSVMSFRVRFGMTDTAPRAWDGTVSAAGGVVLCIRNWRPRAGDKIDGTRGWSLATREGLNFARRPWEEEVPTGVVPYINVPGIIVDLKTTPATSVQFETKQGTFVLTPRILETGKPLSVLGGSVVIDRVATGEPVSAPGYEGDSATMLGGADGEVWAAWVAYRGGSASTGNEVYVRRFNGASWESPQKVTEGLSDIFLAKLGRDRRGGLWVALLGVATLPGLQHCNSEAFAEVPEKRA